MSINPFVLAINVKGAAIEEKGGGPFIAFAALRATLSPASIYRRALILSEVTLEAPSLSITRTAANRYSFTDIIERQQAHKKPASQGTLLYSINNITVTNGTVDFNDLAVDGGRKHTVRNLQFAIPFISNMPYLMDKYIDPKLSAVVDGAAFSFAGKVKPFSKSMETEVDIHLKELNIPRLVAYSPQPPPVELAAGKLGVDLGMTYRISADKIPQLLIRGHARLDGIAVNLKNGQPLFRLPALEVNASKLEAFAKQFEFEAITLDGLELFVRRDAKGQWMYERLLPQKSTVTSPETVQGRKQEPVKAVQQPFVQVSVLNFTNGSVHMSDAVPKGGFKGSLNDIDFKMKHFTTAADKSAEYDLSLQVDNEATITSAGSFSANPLAAKSSTRLAGLNLQRGWPYMARFFTAPLKGVLDLSGEVSFSKDNGLTAENGRLILKNLSTRYGRNDGFDFSQLTVNGAAFKEKENRLEIAEIRLSKGNIALSRETDGQISAMSLLVPQQNMSPKKNNPAASAPQSRSLKTGSVELKDASKTFTYRLKRFQADKLNLLFHDKSRSGKPTFSLRNTGISLANLNGPRFTSAQLRFASTFGKQTTLKASGDITPLPFRYKGSLTVGHLPIRDFEEYFPENLNVFIIGGYLDTALNMDVALKEGKPTGTFKGSAGIRSFHSIDMTAEEDLLKWESLQLDEFRGGLEPFSLNVKEVALNGVYSRIIVRKDGTLNLQNLLLKPASASTPKSQGPSPAPPAAPSGGAVATPSDTEQNARAKGQISIGAVTIQDGTLSFADHHLSQQFNTTFYNLGGRVSGLSSEETKFADVDLRGNLENHSPLQITGKINPLRDDLFVDLMVSFHDIELSPVTPYSGTYLGYTVEKGKLFLDLKYHIEKKELTSDNKIFLDQFTFGNKVESDKATNLPVLLGLALLKDRKGEIHLDVPVTGRTDDPKFSVWKLVFQVLKNLMVKAVTSPLSLLSSMLGSGEDFSAVQFGYGTSVIPPGEEQKLSTLSRALLDRPALKVELKGYVDPEKDVEAYRRELFDRKLRNEKFLTLGKEGTLKEGEKVDAIVVLSEEYAAYLAAVYKKEKFPKPRNVLGLVKNLPPDEMKKLIIANTIIGAPELQALARERVVAVMNYLVRKGNVPAERIFQKEGDVSKAPEKESISRSRVELNAIVQ
ncbi:MAG: DUF748 domain-containing protein [Desulfuromonadaceae bacterium]|nr:DUF748 domain-containing protein [Desulfuromonadaceae bacterium]